MIDNFLKNLSEEHEYKFGTPWRYSDKSLGVVVPILKIGNIEERGYITLEEAKDQGITFKDTGHIDRVMIESSLGIPIFVRSGTALKSTGTQPRAVETSTVIVPEKVPEKEEIPDIPKIIITRQEIPVRCIHASKGIRTNETFGYAGHVPLEVGSVLMARRGQSHTWAAVGETTHRFMASSSFAQSQGRTGRLDFRSISSDNLVGVMEEVDKATSNIDEILKNIPLFEDQVGAIFLDIKDVVAFEMFDHPKSWEAIHKEVEKRLGESATKEQESFYKPDYEKVKPLVLTFLKKLIDSEKTEIFKGHTVSTFLLKGNGVIGEATTIDGKVIHIIGIKEDIKEKSEYKITEMARNIRTATDIFRNIGDAAPVKNRGTVRM